MAKCKNCYHYHTCDWQYRLEDYQECKYYKNKSLIVELPCRASDKVYILIDESENSVVHISRKYLQQAEYGLTDAITTAMI